MNKQQMFIALSAAYNKEMKISKANLVLGHKDMAESCRMEALGIVTAAVALGFDKTEFINESRKLRRLENN